MEVITVPRSINKTDALSLVSAFGSVRAAVNARPEEIGEIPGWGEKKVQRWCGTVRDNFRVRKAAKKGIAPLREGSSIGLLREESSAGLLREDSFFGDEEDAGEQLRNGVPAPALPSGDVSRHASDAVDGTLNQSGKRPAGDVPLLEPGEDEEEALLLAAAEEEGTRASRDNDQTLNSERTKISTRPDEQLNEGMAAALAKLRKE